MVPASAPIRRGLHRTPSGPAPRRISDLQGLEHILRLEQSAEEISQGGSDIGEEIRKMNEAERSRSRQNSIHGSLHGDHTGPTRALPVRMGSTGGASRTSSHGTSVVDVNGSARWGGYSPSGYISSPVGSVTSGSWTHATLNSSSRASRAAPIRMTEPMHEGRPLDSPLGPSNASQHSQEQQLSRHGSQASFAKRWDQIAEEMDVSPLPPPHAEEHTDESAIPHRPRSTDTFQEAQFAFQDFDGVHFNPETEEFVEVDGEGHEIRRIAARSSSGSLMDVAALLRAPPRPISYAAPPPDENMVYYPAPVPRMLNLPKRLSQLPAANVQAKRRTQMLDALSPGARQSAPWLSQVSLGEASSPNPGSKSADHTRGMLNQRMSMANMKDLAPQLRATMYFEHQSVPQDIEIKSESAVATLDSILDASATAPVNAFTDHPYAGDVRKSVYAPELTNRRSTATLGGIEAQKKRNTRRKSSIANLFRRSANIDGELDRPISRGSGSVLDQLNDDEGGSDVLRKRNSAFTPGDESERVERPERPLSQLPELDFVQSGLIAHAANANDEEEVLDTNEARSSVAAPSQDVGADEHAASDERGEDLEGDPEKDVEDDAEDDDAIFAQPSTLLAELQVRKAQQKSRSRTAATAYPNGMHSTLLQLDAVEEINKRNRRNKRVDLAWEDPDARAQDMARDDDDDEVPLGMLFPAKDGLVNRRIGDGRDWSRPLGLMERRELEDNEPLSSRRNRLRGISPPRHVRRPQRATTQPVGPTQTVPIADEPQGDEGETLEQRQRRLQTKDALDTAISDIAPKTGERPLSTFTDEVLSQFGGLNIDTKETTAEPDASTPQLGADAETAEEEQEETLGQRRARLQREREASGVASSDSEQTRPELLRASSSFANLLASNPIGNRSGIMNSSKAHQQPAQGTLLHASAQMQSKHKQDMFNHNSRSSGMMLNKSFLDSRQHALQRNESGGLMGASASRPANGGFAGGLYNHGGQFSVPSPAALGNAVGGSSGYFASPTANLMAYGFPYAAAGMAYPQQTQPRQLAYNALAGVPQNYNAMGGYGYGMPQPQLPGPNVNMNMQNGMGMGSAMGMNVGGPMGMTVPAAFDASLQPEQRTAIDRWRMGIGSG